LNRAGTELGVRVFSDQQPYAILFPARVDTKLREIEGESSSGPTKDSIPQSYVPTLYDLERVHRFASIFSDGPEWPSAETWQLLFGLRMLTKVAPSTRETWLSLLQFGYISIDYDHLLELFDRLWTDTRRELESRVIVTITLPSGPEAMGQLLQGGRPSTLPLRLAPGVRIDGNLALVDFVAAGHMLEMALEFVSDHGATANTRAKHFEAVVQQVVDSSP
jgi:hypothetical protein